MRDKRRAKITKRLAEIREVQRLGAEARAASAKRAARAEEQRRSAASQLLSRRQQAWTATAKGEPLNLALLTAWTASVSTAQAQLALAETDLERAQGDEQARRCELANAAAREAGAQQVAKDAARRVRYRREEARLADVADRFASAWWAR